MNTKQSKYLEQRFYNATEKQFQKLHKYYPEELYLIIRQQGFTSESSFKPIQKEMDRIFALQKIESEFEPINGSPF